jgi:chromosome segregation ATPase
VSEVDQLLSSAKQRFERIKDLEREVTNHYERVQGLLHVLQNAYDENRSDLRERVDSLQDDLDTLEDAMDNLAETLPDLARQSQYDEIHEVVESTEFASLITRDQFIDEYVQSSQ